VTPNYEATNLKINPFGDIYYEAIRMRNRA
jgi:hypothetical protein